MALGKKIVKNEILGDTVHIKTLNGGAAAAELIDLLQQTSSKPSLVLRAGALAVVACLCDESGASLYTDVDEVMEEAASGFLTEFLEAALEVSGLGDDAEQVRKNSGAVQ